MSRIHRKKPANRPMSRIVRHANNAESKIRAHVEHVFAQQKDRMDLDAMPLTNRDDRTVQLKPESGILANASDITDNPKGIQVKELDAGIVGRSIDDLDAAVVNTDRALESNLSRLADHR